MNFIQKNSSRWLILVIDLLIALISVVLSYLLRFNFDIPGNELEDLPKVLLLMLAIRFITFLIFRSYAGVIRYTSTSDALRVSGTLVFGSVLFALSNIITWYSWKIFFIPFSIIIIDLFALTIGMITFRMIVKIAYMEFQYPDRNRVKVIIYGASEAGITAKRVLAQDVTNKYDIVAFIDDNPSLIGKKLEGIDVRSSESLDGMLSSGTIAQLLYASDKPDTARRKAVVEKCLSYNTAVLSVPPMIHWINGELSVNQIRNVRIEELLEREEIRIDEGNVARELTGKTVLITGASGSIGSELARQVAGFTPKKLVLTDQAETPIHSLELEFRERFPELDIEFVLADIFNPIRIRNMLRETSPDVIYHAAAYKHVPVMEKNPAEAVFTNVTGTRLLADLAVENKVGKFIMISTDKAVNPTSIMGASKRIAEIYVQSLNKAGITKFITTRFGNVLGSSGSVIPLFRQQIETGGPVTITHPEVTRFFMTIPEACRLVLEAGTMGRGGEIFLFDMGKPVKILDLAKKMIQLAGLVIGKDIQIRFTGLRPGEKLYEELLNVEENALPTHHPLIMIARVREYDHELISHEIEDLARIAQEPDQMKLVKKMKQIVPEFISRNSIFAGLDDEQPNA